MVAIMQKVIALVLCCTLLTGCKSTSANDIVTDNVKYYTESVTNMNGRSVVLVFYEKDDVLYYKALVSPEDEQFDYVEHYPTKWTKISINDN